MTSFYQFRLHFFPYTKRNSVPIFAIVNKSEVLEGDLDDSQYNTLPGGVIFHKFRILPFVYAPNVFFWPIFTNIREPEAACLNDAWVSEWICLKNTEFPGSVISKWFKSRYWIICPFLSANFKGTIFWRDGFGLK